MRRLILHSPTFVLIAACGDGSIKRDPKLARPVERSD
jgi:hypothetical protein